MGEQSVDVRALIAGRSGRVLEVTDPSPTQRGA